MTDHEGYGTVCAQGIEADWGGQGSAFAVLFTNATCKNVTVTFMITFIYSLRGARTSSYKNSLFVKYLQTTVNEL